MALNIIQIILLVIFALCAIVFISAAVGFKALRESLSYVGEDGFKTYRNDEVSRARLARINKASRTFVKVLPPVALLWVGGAALAALLVIRVVLSFS